MTSYYKMTDLALLAKREYGVGQYIYRNGVWERDTEHLLSDHLMDYGDWRISECHDITEEEAMEIMRNYDQWRYDNGARYEY